MTDAPRQGEEAFDLDAFLPYLLNQAAEATSRGFAQLYRAEYGMTRTQWRVIAHLGRSGALTAAEIGRLSQIEKSKVSRAVTALEAQGWLGRETSSEDRRAEILNLTAKGHDVFRRLGALAVAYDRRLRERLGPDAPRLARMLRGLAASEAGAAAPDGEDQGGP